MQEDNPTPFKQEPVVISKEVVPDKSTGLDKFKKYSVYILVAGVVLSALISIVAVLIGEFNSYVIKALFSTGWIVIHSLVALSFVSLNAQKHEISKEIMINTTFVIVIASFFTSVLGTWEIVSRLTTVHFYFAFVMAMVAAGYCGVILRMLRVDNLTKIAANSTIATTIILYVYSLPWIFENNYYVPELYKRIFISISILLGMFTMLTAIFSRMFLSKHPEIAALDPSIGKISVAPAAKALGFFTKIILLIIFMPLILSVIGYIFRLIGSIFLAF